MTVRRAVLVLVAAMLAAPVAARAQTGGADAGKAFWNGQMECRFCHGANGEGGFGPDLAGRGLSVAQFKQAIRKPWGIMPAFSETQVTDQDVENVVAYVNALPKVASLGAWRFPLPATPNSTGEALFYSMGCAQCHQPAFAGPRAQLGAVGADFDYFKRLVYTHWTEMPEHQKRLSLPTGPIRMGNFNPLRVPEPTLQEIFKYVRDEMKFRPLVRTRVAPPAAGGNSTYTITIENGGLPGRGLTAEDLTVSINIPQGAKLVSTTGGGYEGSRAADAGAQAAVWRVPSLPPGKQETYTITFAQPVENLRGNVRWMKPAIPGGMPDAANIGIPNAGRGRGPAAE
jgi:mono/diheme cytochrome c family protein